MDKSLRYSRMTRTIFTLVFVALVGLSFSRAQVKERFNKGESKAPEEEEEQEELKRTNKPRGTSSSIFDKLVFGGDAAVGFSATSTFIYLAPSVGYRVTDNLVTGLGYIYQFSKINRIYNSFTGSWINFDDPGQTIHGPKMFFNYRFLESFYVGSQFEYLNHDFGYYVSGTNSPRYDNLWTPVWFLEAGFTQAIGRKGYAVVGIRFNVLHDYQSPYATSWFPVIGVYF